jgi:hypothetical protein
MLELTSLLMNKSVWYAILSSKTGVQISGGIIQRAFASCSLSPFVDEEAGSLQVVSQLLEVRDALSAGGSLEISSGLDGHM